MATQSAPSHNVFTVEDRGDNEDPFWLKIGAAWAHKDGKGFNLTLSALPLDGRLVLREPTENEDERPAPRQQRKSKR